MLGLGWDTLGQAHGRGCLVMFPRGVCAAAETCLAL